MIPVLLRYEPDSSYVTLISESAVILAFSKFAVTISTVEPAPVRAILPLSPIVTVGAVAVKEILFFVSTISPLIVILPPVSKELTGFFSLKSAV